MDGNGRWAKARLAPSCRAQAGNGDGQNDHSKAASDLGVKVLTFICFFQRKIGKGLKAEVGF